MYKNEKNRRRRPNTYGKCTKFLHWELKSLSPRFLIFWENLLEVNFFRFTYRKGKNLSTRVIFKTFMQSFFILHRVLDVFIISSSVINFILVLVNLSFVLGGGGSKMKEKRPYFWPIPSFLLLDIGKLLTKRSDSVSCSIIYLTQAFLGSTKNEHGLKLAIFTKMAQIGEKIMEVGNFQWPQGVWKIFSGMGTISVTKNTIRGRKCKEMKKIVAGEQAPLESA